MVARPNSVGAEARDSHATMLSLPPARQPISVAASAPSHKYWTKPLGEEQRMLGQQRSSDKLGRHHLGLTRHRFSLDSRDKLGRKVRGQTLNDVQ